MNLSPAERFWKKVNRTPTCWLWTAGTCGDCAEGWHSDDGTDAPRAPAGGRSYPMSGTRVNWNLIARELERSGVTLTPYGQSLALPRRSICSWCQAEGILNVLREGVLPISHGCCEKHAQAMLKEAGLA